MGLCHQAETLLEILRGSIVESCHAGHIAVVTGEGSLVASLGNPNATIFIRSCAKPLQAISIITSGAFDAFGLTKKELAIACGSHDGTPQHTETVASMLDKMGLSEQDLKCGTHPPYFKETAKALQEEKKQPTALHNNCSGNHAGILATCVHLGFGVQAYNDPNHPVQELIKNVVANFANTDSEEIAFAIDNCSIPTYALSVQTLASCFARFVSPPNTFDTTLKKACSQIINAMTGHPVLVEGEKELDTELMRVTNGRLISKVGAEGVYAAGVLPCERWTKGLGVAFKISDGDKGDRARAIIAVEVLKQLEILSQEDIKVLKDFTAKPIKNHRGIEVGKTETKFSLNLH